MRANCGYKYEYFNNIGQLNHVEYAVCKTIYVNHELIVCRKCGYDEYKYVHNKIKRCTKTVKKIENSI